MAAGRGLRAGREPDRKSRNYLLFGSDRRSRRVPLVGTVDVAVRHPLDALFHAHSLNVALNVALNPVTWALQRGDRRRRVWKCAKPWGGATLPAQNSEQHGLRLLVTAHRTSGITHP